MITRSKQDWSTGQQVKVGFLTLRVIGCVKTPGNYLPDQYVLTSLDGARIYRFIPHNGLQRCESLREAMEYA